MQGALQFAAMIASVVLVSLVEAYPAISVPCAADLRDLPRLLAGVSRCAAGAADPGGQAAGLARAHAPIRSTWCTRWWCCSPEYFVRAVGPGEHPRRWIRSGQACRRRLNLVVSLAAVLIVSHFTYLYVEIPGGKFMRNCACAAAADFARILPRHRARLTN